MPKEVPCSFCGNIILAGNDEEQPICVPCNIHKRKMKELKYKEHEQELRAERKRRKLEKEKRERKSP